MIIDSVRNFIRTCPLIDSKVNIDYLGVDVGEFSIETVPAEPIIKKYVDGGSIRQHLFVLASRNTYSPDVVDQMENIGFFEKFQDWLEAQVKAGNLPELGDGKNALNIEVTSGGYLFDSDSDQAKYHMQCRLVYSQI